MPPTLNLLPAHLLSEREQWAVRLVGNRSWAEPERRELLDFLGHPEQMPSGADLFEAVVARILAARAAGAHIG